MINIKNDKYNCPKCKQNELILWDKNSKASCNSCSYTFNSKELLDILLEISDRFEVINPGLSDPTFTPGGISRTNRKVKCPMCDNTFGQQVESGCFNITETPPFCPKCDHPSSTVDLTLLLMKVT